ncbi:rhodanese-like domain-containing protein [Alteromonas gracilis]|uniref:rhodanese-like domain-containing protein n=1 Tax=Alteromonas gracilis TaxID=1479524 RepID=UPI003735CF0B
MLIDLKTRINNIDANVRTVTAEQAATELSQNKGTLIDVREAAEVTSQPVPASLHIPRGILEMKALELFKDEATPLYIHCASGIRAKLAAEQLSKMGYSNISVVTCAIDTINQVNQR